MLEGIGKLSLEEKLIVIVIWNAFCALKGVLTAITTHIEDRKLSNTLEDLTIALLMNVIFISLLAFTKIFG